VAKAARGRHDRHAADHGRRRLPGGCPCPVLQERQADLEGDLRALDELRAPLFGLPKCGNRNK
jgi:hypothetical protein